MQALLDADSRTRHGKFGDVTKEQLTDYEICNKQLASIIDIGNSMKHQLHQLIEWFKSLGIFNELCLDDQAGLTQQLSYYRVGLVVWQWVGLT